MAKDRINFSKEYKLFNACAKESPFSPQKERIYFQNNSAYATDGSILVRVPLSCCTTLPQEEYTKLNGFNIHHKLLKLLYGFDKVTIERTLAAEDVYGNLLDEPETAVYIRVAYEGQAISCRLERSKQEDEAVFENVLTSPEDHKPLHGLGINAGNLKRISEAMNLDRIKMDFTTVGSKIYITSTDEDDAKNGLLGLIMPVLVEPTLPGMEEENDD